MDFLDRASELEQKHTQMALTSHFKNKQPKLVISAVRCIECDEAIPEARRVASQGCQYCIYCQGLADMGKL